MQLSKATKTALFLKTKHLGDSIILTSAIAALPPEFIVDVLCFKESEPIFEMSPRVRQVYVVPRHLEGWAKIRQYWYILSGMRASQYDLLAQFSDDWRGALFARILKTKMSVAREPKKRPAIWRKSFQHIAKQTSFRRPAAEQDVDLLRKVRLFNEPIAPPYQIVLKPDLIEQVNAELNKKIDKLGEKKIVALHAAARWKFKGLPHDTWAKVINSLHSRGYCVILTGAPSDLAFNQEIVALCQIAPLLISNYDLNLTAALIKRANVLLSIDSMPIHLASALQTPVVAIFGPTNDRVWAPWSVPHRVLSLSENDSPSFACRPCGLDGCAGSKVSQCLVAVSAESIVNALEELVNQQIISFSNTPKQI